MRDILLSYLQEDCNIQKDLGIQSSYRFASTNNVIPTEHIH